jgi:phosphatidylserine/phosphatidylglycerophosphate/cardiolipin synthase-like enzyme
MPPRKRSTRNQPCDLNQYVTSKKRKCPKEYKRGQLRLSILFDGQEIENAIINHVKRQDTIYVIGCVAWMSNKKILKYMADYLSGVSIVTTNDQLVKRRSNQIAYRQLPACYNDAIRTIGVRKGRFKSLMHHKFLCGLDHNRNAIWVMNGSFNLTESAVTNLENVMFLQDSVIANSFLEEFLRIYHRAQPWN